MTIEHNAITDPFIHEPKNVATAAVNTVYVASGTGTGVWKAYYPSDFISFEVDIHLAAAGYYVSAIAGTISKIYMVTDIANTSSTCNVTFSIGGTTITNGAIALAGSTAAGTQVNSTPTANNVISVGSVIGVASDTGNITAATKAKITMLISPRTQ